MCNHLSNSCRHSNQTIFFAVYFIICHTVNFLFCQLPTSSILTLSISFLVNFDKVGSDEVGRYHLFLCGGRVCMCAHMFTDSTSLEFFGTCVIYLGLRQKYLNRKFHHRLHMGLSSILMMIANEPPLY